MSIGLALPKLFANRLAPANANRYTLGASKGSGEMAARGTGWAIGASMAGLICGAVLVAALAAPPAKLEAIPISIGGGAADSAAFHWSSALAEVLSRPPGLPKCDPNSPCGVAGVVAGSQTFGAPGVLIKALADGTVTTGILPALDLYQARCAPGSTVDLRALRALYRQPIQILGRDGVAPSGPKDFAGKTLAIGLAGSDSETVALALLDAYGVPRKKVKLVRLTPHLALAAVRSGTADAAILLTHAADPDLTELTATGGFSLVALPDGAERRRLARALPVLAPAEIAAAAGAHATPTPTLAQDVLWVAGPNFDQHMAQTVVEALSESKNASYLASLVAPVPAIPPTEAFLRLAVPLAIGPAYYADKAKLPVGVLDCGGATASR